MQSEEMKVTCTEPGQQGLATLAVIEYRIATHMQGAYENVIEVGRCLCEAKDAGLVPHGQWEEWVQRNTGMSVRSAQKLMQTARSVQVGSSLARLPISKITTILSLPEPEREPMAERAAAEDMSLRELQEAVKREKQRADKAEAKRLEVEGNMRSHDAQAAHERKQLREQLEQARARTAAPSTGISPEAQAEIDRLRAEIDRMGNCAGEEIDRLKNELAEAEGYAEKQAELRQQAQQELLNQRAQAARGERAQAAAFGPVELAAAVQAFICAAGVLPHLGPNVAQIGESERAQMRQYVDMVATWVEGSRRTLATVIISGEA